MNAQRGTSSDSNVRGPRSIVRHEKVPAVVLAMLAGAWLGLGCSSSETSPEAGGSSGAGSELGPGQPSGSGSFVRPELCGLHARCKDGEINAVYGNACYEITERCELGCRTDQGVEPEYQDDGPEESARERSHIVCEEYRLSHGPRRPGDRCELEYDCLSYPESTAPQGLPWPRLMRCVDGTCQERAASVPSDFGAACAAEQPPVGVNLGSPGVVVKGGCDNGICNLHDDGSGAERAGACSMQCVEDADCPAGSVCRALMLGVYDDFYNAAFASVCVDACAGASPCDAAPGPEPHDAGAPDATAPDASR
jgi:hypothetical protein